MSKTTRPQRHVTIRVYPNKLDHSNPEKLRTAPGITIENWLFKTAPNYKPSKIPPLDITLNGVYVPVSAWPLVELQAGDLLEVEVQPRDFTATTWAIIAIVTAAASAAYSFYMMGQIPDNYAKTTKSGSSIYSANAQGNEAALLSPIPEHFGTHKAFPDLKAEPHSFYKNNKQYKNFLLSQGRGYYSRTLQTLYISNTPSTDYGTSVDVLIADPGEDISGHPAHRCMYSAPDVSSTSSSAGFELKGPITVAVASADGLSCTFSGETISIRKQYSYQTYNSSTEEYTTKTYYKKYSLPWPADTKFTITGTSTEVGSYSGNVNLIDTGYDAQSNPLPDEIHAPFGLSVFTVGQQITLINAGPNSGNYYVRSVTDTVMTLKDETGAAVTWITPANAVNVKITASQTDDGLYKIVSIDDGIHYVKKIDAVSYEVYPGWSGFTFSGVASDVSMEVMGEELTGVAVGPYRSNPRKKPSTDYELDFLLPKGLGYLNNDGGFDSRTVTIKIEYRVAGSSNNWQFVTKTFTDATNDQLADTVAITLPSAEYEWRCTNTSATSEDTKLLDAVQWVGLKSLIAAPTSYADETIICISLIGTERISAASENKISTYWTRKLPIPDGNGGWTTDLHATEDIAPVYRYIAKDVNYQDNRIGTDALLSLHENVWVPRGEKFNCRFDENTTALEALKRVLAAGMSEQTLDIGKITPVRRGLRTLPQHMYQPENITKSSLEFVATHPDPLEADGVEVEYMNPETWKSDTVLCLLPEDEGANPEKYRAYGVTDRTQAWRIGMRLRMKRKHRRMTGKFGTEMDLFNSKYADCVAVGVNYQDSLQTGRIEAVAGTIIETSNPVAVVTGADATMLIRRPDGTASGPYTATVVDDYHVMLDRALDFTPELNGQLEHPLYQIGQYIKVWIENVKPSGTTKASADFSVYTDLEFAHDDRYPSNDAFPESLAEEDLT